MLPPPGPPGRPPARPARPGAALAGALLGALLPAWPAAAHGAAEDKSGYTPWRPTPRRRLRELSADRPDKTDSPYTVDAGHVQLEMDAVNWARDRHNPERRDVAVSATEVAPINLKVGVWNNLDAQFVLPAWHEEEARDLAAGSVQRTRGFTDLTPRLKLNLWGNDGGSTALAVMPFVALPTATGTAASNPWAGGVKFPFTLDLPGWEVSAMTEFDWRRDGPGGSFRPAFVNSVSLGHALVGRFSVYAEFYSSVSTAARAEWVGAFDTWLTFSLTADVRLDAGVYLGVTRAAEDWHPFLGLTWRW